MDDPDTPRRPFAIHSNISSGNYLIIVILVTAVLLPAVILRM